MVLSQDEVNALTRKRYGSREALASWFRQVDEVVGTELQKDRRTV